MRLSAEQFAAIKQEAEHFFSSRAEVRLYQTALVEILRHVGKFTSRYHHE